MSGGLPLLVMGIGNPSRGDDALGPLLIERLADVAGADVTLLCDFQLQVEHALDLLAHRAVLLVDAAWPAPGQGRVVMLDAITPDHAPMLLSHAQRPQALLGATRALYGQCPPVWQLVMPGEHFTLGDPPSPEGMQRLDEAEGLARAWVATQQALCEGRGPSQACGTPRPTAIDDPAGCALRGPRG